MRYLILFGLLVLSSTLFSQNVSVINDTVYLDNQSIGDLKHVKESLASINSENTVEKTTTLYTFDFQPKETIKTIKDVLGDKYENFEVKQKSHNALYRSGQSLNRASTFQMIGLIGIPISFINPIIGGSITLISFVGSIYETNKAGKILSGEL
jgi:hypothetical protein